MDKILKKITNLGTFLFYFPQKLFLKLRASLITERKIRAKIGQHEKNFSLSETSVREKIMLATSFRINNLEREEILTTTFKYSLGELEGSNIDFCVSDASEGDFAARNSKLLETFSGLNVRYTNKPERLNSAYYNLLSQADKPYFCMVFDDFPIMGMNEHFLAASCALLDDFKGLVEIILIEGAIGSKIDHEGKRILYDLNSRDFVTNHIEPLGVVTYGGYEFAIVKNFHYGFFFNTLIASTKGYGERLKWYMDHIDYNSPHAIELAAKRHIGPVYQFIAIPLKVFNFDIDFVHTEISSRSVGSEVYELAKAMQSGYFLQEK